jgi:hypothetical protein
MGTQVPGVGTQVPGVGTLVPGAGVVIGTTDAMTFTTITVFPSDSFRIGIQDGGMIMDTLIIRITRMAIPITIIRTTAIRTTAIRTTAIRTTALRITATTLAEPDQRASKC